MSQEPMGDNAPYVSPSIVYLCHNDFIEENILKNRLSCVFVQAPVC